MKKEDVKVYKTPQKRMFSIIIFIFGWFGILYCYLKYRKNKEAMENFKSVLIPMTLITVLWTFFLVYSVYYFLKH